MHLISDQLPNWIKGYGSGYGYGYGYGDGSGDGSGSGYGYGYGDGSGDIYVEHDAPLVAYHCVPMDKKIRYDHNGDRPEIKVGLVLEWDENNLKMCERGLHASYTPKMARRYCDGILCKVACSGKVIQGEDKLVCSRREILEIMEN